MVELNLKLVEYHDQRVLTTIQLAGLFDVSSETIHEKYKMLEAKLKNKVDYFIIKGKELNDFKESFPDQIPKEKSRVFLWTVNGCLKLSESINTQRSWSVYKTLVTAYFSSKTLPPAKNEFDLMREIIDNLESVKYEVNDTKQIATYALKASNEALEKAQKIEDKLKSAENINEINASNIAVELHLYSRSGLPHCQLIGTIAQCLGMHVDIKGYLDDDNIIIVPDQSKGNRHWQVYYKPVGMQKIIDWFKENRDHIGFKEYYKRDTLHGKKGDLKGYGYKINGKRFWLNLKDNDKIYVT